jgi:hypothetical protein
MRAAPGESLGPARSRRLRVLVLLIAFVAAALLGVHLVSVWADEPPTATPVTAQPPHEAVPAASAGNPARLRACTAAANSKQLTGQSRSSFVSGCMKPLRRN